ncbi:MULTISPECIES: hypothetical protein [unclassified Bradyrhizobium]|uniref:hypothetical protein n=1 Tax=unclassified Bradyrhizobium TaxID=2631580 RepID=UPI0028E44AFA|nr:MULTISPECIES: hypothetical protein [unclassified Bradyrhizobium]
MQLLKSVTESDLKANRIKWAEEFPGSHFGCRLDIRSYSRNALRNALAVGSEEAIQKVLTKNPYLIQYAVDHSGHHGIWIFPKPMIKPRGLDKSPGLIPDYLVVTRSSLGYVWHIVELKRFNVQFSRRDGRGLSQVGNQAVIQCSSYLSHFQDYIDAVRSNIRVNELIQPKGAILLIGDSATETKKQRDCRANFVRTTPSIQVVSYRRVVESFESDSRF